MGCAVAPRGPLQLFCLQRPGPWMAASTPSLEDEVQVGRAGRGTETLRQVPEVRNLLRHLNQRELHAQKVPHTVAVAKERRGARGESEKAVGSSRGGNGDVLGIWQGRRPPGSRGSLSWARRGLSFSRSSAAQRAAGLGEVRAARTCSLSRGRKKTRKEEALPRGAFCKTSEQRRARARNFGFGSRSPFQTRR